MRYRKPDYQLPQERTSQMPLPIGMPDVGQRYRNIYSGYFGTVLQVKQERRCWVTLRKNGAEDTITLDALNTYWRPYDSATDSAKLTDAP